MAEALAIFGSVAAVISIIDVLARATNTLAEVSKQWNDLSVLSLMSQLRALSAALKKISEWMEVEDHEVHHELVIDVDASIRCCQILATKIEAELEKLHQNSDGSLLWRKGKSLLKGSGLADLQNMMDRQTSTLTLLLTACNRYVVGWILLEQDLIFVAKPSQNNIVSCDNRPPANL